MLKPGVLPWYPSHLCTLFPWGCFSDGYRHCTRQQTSRTYRRRMTIMHFVVCESLPGCWNHIYIITIKRCLNNLSFWSEWSTNSASNTFIGVMANIYFLKSLAFQWSKGRSTTSVPCFKNGGPNAVLFRWTDSTCEVGIRDASWINVVDVHPGFVSKNYTSWVGWRGNKVWKFRKPPCFVGCLIFTGKRKHASHESFS